LLKEHDVGVAPGYTFGPGNEEHFRLCFAQSHQRLTEALQRIVVHIDRQE
jgi:aspartate/methionine/tyrosine aminotransferase